MMGPRRISDSPRELTGWQPTKTLKQLMESLTATKTPTSGIQIQNMENGKFEEH